MEQKFVHNDTLTHWGRNCVNPIILSHAQQYPFTNMFLSTLNSKLFSFSRGQLQPELFLNFHICAQQWRSWRWRRECIFIYVHSKLYWMSVGRLPKVPSLSAPLASSHCFSLFCVFVEGAKLCSIRAGWSTRGERTFPQAPGRAE